ncbi:MAG: KdsC family phosphatase, partial [Planctomycetia bacterium]
QRVRLLLLDVDGVLTDGSIVLNDDGVETKAFSVRDGFAIRCWQRAGGLVGILSGRTSAATQRRAEALGVTLVVQGAEDKVPAFLRLLAETELTADEVCYIGDDLPDLPIILAAGIGATVADGVAAVREHCDWISAAPGGRHAVRELIERLLQARGAWRETLDYYRRPLERDAA